MGGGDQGTSEGVDILKNPTAEEEEPQAPSGTRKKGKEASAPEGSNLGLKLKEASTLGGNKILKKWKEAMAALDIMLPTKPAARKAQPAGVEKKRKKVVKKKLPQDVIDSIVAKPCKIVYELSDEDLADKSQQFREAYRRAMLVNEKVRSYEQALMEQYRATGSVEDEIEVTDDEDEGMGEKITGDEEETSANKVTGSVEDEIEVTDDEDEGTGEKVTGDEETSVNKLGHR